MAVVFLMSSPDPASGDPAAVAVAQTANLLPLPILSVFASTVSRLHAIVILARLKRKGILPGAISVIQPPCAAYDWVAISGLPPLTVGLSGRLSVAVTGRLGRALAVFEGWLGARLDAAGFDVVQRAAIEESMGENRIVLCIETGGEEALRIVLQVLEDNGAEKIFALEMETTPGAPRMICRSPSPCSFDTIAAQRQRGDDSRSWQWLAQQPA